VGPTREHPVIGQERTGSMVGSEGSKMGARSGAWSSRNSRERLNMFWSAVQNFGSALPPALLGRSRSEHAPGLRSGGGGGGVLPITMILVILLVVLGDILMAQVGESSVAAAAVVVYGTCSMDMETLSLVRYPWRRNTLLVLSCCCS
jgi:hypothetical protein